MKRNKMLGVHDIRSCQTWRAFDAHPRQCCRHLYQRLPGALSWTDASSRQNGLHRCRCSRRRERRRSCRGSCRLGSFQTAACACWQTRSFSHGQDGESGSGGRCEMLLGDPGEGGRRAAASGRPRQDGGADVAARLLAGEAQGMGPLCRGLRERLGHRRPCHARSSRTWQSGGCRGGPQI